MLLFRMFAKNKKYGKRFYHDLIRFALEKEGWKITHDPYPVRTLGLDGEIDLGAERIIGAEKENEGVVEKIAIEIKSFLSPSFMKDFHNAVGQYLNYKVLLKGKDADRILFLALPNETYKKRFHLEGVQLIVSEIQMHIIVFDENEQSIILWEK